MNKDKQQLIEQQLHPDERLIWSGEPDARRMTRNYILPGWGAALLVFAALGFFGIDLLLLLLFALSMAVIMPLVGLLWIYPDAKHTVYAITERRVLIMNTRRPDTPHELVEQDIGPIRRFDNRDGSGDLLFANDTYRRSRRRGSTRHFGFFGISNPQQVEQHLHDVFPHSAAQGPARS